MIEAAKPFVNDYQLVLAGAPSIDPAYYQQYIGTDVPVRIVFGQTYRLLAQAKVALVTSGTATLETALFRVPQVVCYYLAMGKLISFLRRHILKVKYISLVNLVANREVVRELVADTMTVENVRSELDALLNKDDYRNKMLQEYDRMIKILGPAGASHQAASKMINLLSVRKGK
jgi:lipid-A-disaccharide synthase